MSLALLPVSSNVNKHEISEKVAHVACQALHLILCNSIRCWWLSLKFEWHSDLLLLEETSSLGIKVELSFGKIKLQQKQETLRLHATNRCLSLYNQPGMLKFAVLKVSLTQQSELMVRERVEGAVTHLSELVLTLEWIIAVEIIGKSSWKSGYCEGTHNNIFFN